ncbi:hypothetical protein [Sorangium sp. So ce854]|uniref:hypothetical protein n=1 Tax=Sorangium sp. So ce854 TaxID=3133322 RepID=UPI003F5FA3E6
MGAVERAMMEHVDGRIQASPTVTRDDVENRFETSSCREKYTEPTGMHRAG